MAKKSLKKHRMSKKDEKRIEKLMDEVVVLLNRVHKLELTTSRVKNELEELLQKTMIRDIDG